jgi:hypothetical protein
MRLTPQERRRDLADYIKANPKKSVREIAKATGASHGTAQRAKAGVPLGTPARMTAKRTKTEIAQAEDDDEENDDISLDENEPFENHRAGRADEAIRYLMTRAETI